MAAKTYFQVVIDGKPQRFVGGPTKGCVVPAGDGLDFPDEFSSEESARSKADRFGLVAYGIRRVLRDIGTPTNLAEVGF